MAYSKRATPRASVYMNELFQCSQVPGFRIFFFSTVPVAMRSGLGRCSLAAPDARRELRNFFCCPQPLPSSMMNLSSNSLAAAARPAQLRYPRRPLLLLQTAAKSLE
jgi:hypothetical protein